MTMLALLFSLVRLRDRLLLHRKFLHAPLDIDPALSGHDVGISNAIALLLLELHKQEVQYASTITHLAFTCDAPTPWLTTPSRPSTSENHIVTSSKLFTHELKQFIRFIKPTDLEHDLRTYVVNKLTHVIQNSQWSDAEIYTFGSYETKLYLPTADIDIVIISERMAGVAKLSEVLYSLSELLKRKGIASTTQIISKARVPILKLISVIGGLNIDISINMKGGRENVGVVLRCLNEVDREAAAALILLVKAFLAKKQLAEVINGGVGGLAVCCLVISFLQHNYKERTIPSDEKLGILVTEFLYYYGYIFDYENKSIDITNGGSHPPKSLLESRRTSNPTSFTSTSLTPPPPKHSNEPYLLSIIDPSDPTNDLTTGSYHIRQIRSAFCGSHMDICALVSHAASHPGKSLLVPIFGNLQFVEKRRREVGRIVAGLVAVERGRKVPPSFGVYDDCGNYL